jgi:hypothetical protein
VDPRRALLLGALGVVIVAAAVPVAAEASSARAHPFTGVPSSPTAVVLISGNRSLAAKWTESATGSITYTATAIAAGKATKSCTAKTFGCKIASLIDGVVYDVTVTAKSTGLASAPSSPVSAIVGVPVAPHSVRATPGPASVTVSWARPTASGVSHVTSYMATANPGGFSCSTSGSKPARTCLIAGLTSGAKYTVTVTATNPYGTGSPSKPATVTPN